MARRERKDVIEDGRYSKVDCEDVFDGRGTENVNGKALRVCEAARARMAVIRGVLLARASLLVARLLFLREITMSAQVVLHEKIRLGCN